MHISDLRENLKRADSIHGLKTWSDKAFFASQPAQTTIWVSLKLDKKKDEPEVSIYNGNSLVALIWSDIETFEASKFIRSFA